MNNWFPIYIITAHFIGDWFLQSRGMALSKSKNAWVMFVHLMIVNWLLFALVWPHMDVTWEQFQGRLITNFWLHGLMDWFGPRLYLLIRGKSAYRQDAVHLQKPNYRRDDLVTFEPIKEAVHDYWFFSYVALDQWFHLFVLFALFC